MLTEGERRFCAQIKERVDALRQYLEAHELPDPYQSIARWYEVLSGMKRIQGNANNDISFVAALLAKEYLKSRFPDVTFDAAEKPQGAAGLDIDVAVDADVRIVGEIKTTIPYRNTDFGAQQREAFEKDFSKLNRADAIHKFMFVTEQSTYDILCRPNYQSRIPEVEVVNLMTGASSRSLGGEDPSAKRSRQYKYEPLGMFLGNLGEERTEITLSFEVVERILGCRLPASAYKHPEWWANQSDTSNRPQARAWMKAGFRVARFIQSEDGGWVRFERI